MTNTPYIPNSNSNPSSMPPEPPMRSDIPAGQQPEPMQYQPQPTQPTPTEPQPQMFQSAQAAQPAPAPQPAPYTQPVGAQPQPAEPQPSSAPYQGAGSQPGAPSAGSTPPQYGQHASNGAGPIPPGAPASMAAAPSAKNTGSAFKTFIFGFLGALIACLLAFGGFFAFGGNKNAAISSTTIGTTDSSVIDAVEEGQTLAEAVAAKALPSVVAVYNYQKASGNPYLFGYGYGVSDDDSTSPAGMGSGVIISADGYIITNYHVVEGADELTVTIDGQELEATYVGGDKSSDVAVVKVDETDDLVPADIGNSDDLAIGEWVMTIGAPLGLEQSVATGVVSATNRSTIMSADSDSISGYTTQSGEYTYYPNMIQTDAVINPGNSGGALVDADGKLIGINTMISSYSGDYAGVGFAIPVNYAIGIATDIIAGKTPTHAMLGVSISTLNAQIAQRMGLSIDTGAYINAITPGTGAADSDLREGDIITAIDGEAVASATDVTLQVRAHNVGQTVTVTVDRNGQTLDIPVTLTSDENLTAQQQEETQQQEQQQQQQPNGGNNQNYRNLEDILRMFGM